MHRSIAPCGMHPVWTRSFVTASASFPTTLSTEIQAIKTTVPSRAEIKDVELDRLPKMPSDSNEFFSTASQATGNGLPLQALMHFYSAI